MIAKGSPKAASRLGSPAVRTSPATAAVRSVRRASHAGSPGGIHNIFVAVLAVRPRPLARRVPGSAPARIDLRLVPAEGVAPARRPGVADIAVVGERPVHVGRRAKADPRERGQRAPMQTRGVARVLLQIAESPASCRQGLSARNNV